jgi:hypothetical protein
MLSAISKCRSPSKPRLHLHSEDREEQEHNSTRPVLSREHINGRREPKDDVQNARSPNELLRKQTCHPNIPIRKDNSNSKTEYEEDECIRVETEIVATTVDTTAIEAFGLRVALNGDGGDDDEAGEGDQEL